jgi:hypothetical protein
MYLPSILRRWESSHCGRYLVVSVRFGDRSHSLRAEISLDVSDSVYAYAGAFLLPKVKTDPRESFSRDAAVRRR